MCVCVCVCVCVVCVRACVYACVCVYANAVQAQTRMMKKDIFISKIKTQNNREEGNCELLFLLK